MKKEPWRKPHAVSTSLVAPYCTVVVSLFRTLERRLFLHNDLECTINSQYDFKVPDPSREVSVTGIQVASATPFLGLVISWSDRRLNQCTGMSNMLVSLIGQIDAITGINILYLYVRCRVCCFAL